MGVSKPTQPSVFSANSKNIKRFQLSQRFGNLTVLLIIGIPLVLAGVAYSTYRRIIAPPAEEAIAINDAATPLDPSQTVNDPYLTIDPTTGAPITSDTPAGTTPSSPAPAPGGAQQPASSAMPEGVVVAINSIEANGVKNNPYVAVDTSGLPDGVAISIDRGSWTQNGPSEGTVNGYIDYYGQPLGGSLTFTDTGGTWKVTSYSLR